MGVWVSDGWGMWQHAQEPGRAGCGGHGEGQGIKDVEPDGWGSGSWCTGWVDAWELWTWAKRIIWRDWAGEGVDAWGMNLRM